MNLGAHTEIGDTAYREVMSRPDQLALGHLDSEAPGEGEAQAPQTPQFPDVESVVAPRVPNLVGTGPTNPIDEVTYVLPRRFPVLAAMVVFGLAAIPIGFLLELHARLNQGTSITPAEPAVGTTRQIETTSLPGPTSRTGNAAQENVSDQAQVSSNDQRANVETKRARAPRVHDQAAANAPPSRRSSGTHRNAVHAPAAPVHKSTQPGAAESSPGTPIGQVFLDRRGELVDAQGRAIP